jgi:hypothetical protein
VNTVSGIHPIVKCRYCLKERRYKWRELAEYIPVALYRQMQRKRYFDTEKADKLNLEMLNNFSVDQLKEAGLQV